MGKKNKKNKTKTTNSPAGAEAGRPAASHCPLGYQDSVDLMFRSCCPCDPGPATQQPELARPLRPDEVSTWEFEDETAAAILAARASRALNKLVDQGAHISPSSCDNTAAPGLMLLTARALLYLARAACLEQGLPRHFPPGEGA